MDPFPRSYSRHQGSHGEKPVNCNCVLGSQCLGVCLSLPCPILSIHTLFVYRSGSLLVQPVWREHQMSEQSAGSTSVPTHPETRHFGVHCGTQQPPLRIFPGIYKISSCPGPRPSSLTLTHLPRPLSTSPRLPACFSIPHCSTMTDDITQNMSPPP